MSNIKNYFTVKSLKSNSKISTVEKISPPPKIRKDDRELFELCSTSTSSTHQDQVSH